MHLCSHLRNLSTRDRGVTSDNLIWLLDKLIQLKSSSPSFCSKLEKWYLDNNQIDDRGVSTLMAHRPSLLPCLWCGEFMSGTINLFNNPVSGEMMERVKSKMRRRRRERVKRREEELHREVSPCTVTSML